MRKIITIILAGCMVFCLTACGENQKTAEYKLGFGVVPTSDSSSAGTIQTDTTFAAVILDKDGLIADCKLDVAQNKVDVTGGKISEKAYDDDFKTKQEKGLEYGMKKASGIEKEWYEQADFFCDYVVGMTSQQVAAIATNNGKATDDKLLAGCTISVSDFIKAVTAACDDSDAKTFSSTVFNLGVSASTILDNTSKDAGDGDGLVKMSTDIAAVAADKDGRVLALRIDVFQPEINFDITGEITSDSGEGMKTKRQLGDEYGMKQYSGIKKEWYEQAEAFENYVVGLSKSEIAGMETATNESTGSITAKDDVLLAGCTISVGGFMKATDKAIDAID